MAFVLLFLILLLLLGGITIKAASFLIWLAVVFLILWTAGWVIGAGSESGRRWFGRGP